MSLRLVLVHRDKGSSRPSLVPVCVLVIAAVLLMGGDIESNPGPNGKKGLGECTIHVLVAQEAILTKGLTLA